MSAYSPHDVFIAQRNAANDKFVETVLVASPNKFVCFDSGSNLTTNAVVTASIAVTSSFSVSASFAQTSSYSYQTITSSWASHTLNADSATSASHALQSNNANTATSASHALQANNANTATSASHALQANNANTATSASHALRSDIADSVISASHALRSNASDTSISASHADLTDTASYSITSSYAVSASNANLRGTTDYVPLWTPNGLSATSSIRIDSGSFVNINDQTVLDPTNRPALAVSVPSERTNTLIRAKGEKDAFLQLDIKNDETSANASSDLVATNDQGTDTNYYVDVGINSSIYSDPAFTIGVENDAYLYNKGGKLTIGTGTPDKDVIFHVGGTLAENEVGRIISGSGFQITGSLTGTSSWANQVLTASYLQTLSQSILPARDNTYDLGSIDLQWRDIYVSSASIFINGVPITTVDGQIYMSGSPAITAEVLSGSSIPTTASAAVSASYANTASSVDFNYQTPIVSGSILPITSSEAVTSSFTTTASFAVNAAFSYQTPITTGSLLEITSSHSITSSFSSITNDVIPGVSFYQVSGSSGSVPSYIESFEVFNGNTQSLNYRPPHVESRMFYDQEFNCWDYYTDKNGFRVHLGREVSWRCYNPSGSSLPRGAAIYISGSTDGIHPDIHLAIADATNTKSDVVGLLRDVIPSASYGYVIQNGVMYNVNMVGFNVSDPLYLSNITPGGMRNTDPGQPYETVRIGNCSTTGASGAVIISPIFSVPPTYAYAGMTSVPYITGSAGEIWVDSGSVNLYNNTDGTGLILAYAIPAATMSLITGSTNYIVAELSNSLATYTLTTDSTYTNGTTKTSVATLDIFTENGTRWDIHQFNVGIVGLALANKINRKDIRLYGYQREDGLTLYTTGSEGNFGITAGTVWYGPNSHVIDAFESTTPGTFELYRFVSTASDGTSSWLQTTQSVYENCYYNSSSYGLIGLTENSWSVNYVYRLMGTDDEAVIVLSSEQFTTELEASNNAATPPNLPLTIVDLGLLVGRIIVQSSSFSPTIESAFSNVFVPAVVTDHESLLGLQGGQGGEYYHMTFADYTGTGTGIMVRQSNATMSNPMFNGATKYHIPYWNSHRQLTLTGSVQVVDDKYVVVNSASVDGTNPEALLVKQIDPTSVNLIAGYGDVDNFLQANIQNFSTGSSSISVYTATANNGTLYTNYVVVGIVGSNYSGSSAGQILPIAEPLDAFLECEGGNLLVGTQNNGKEIKFYVETASADHVKAVIKSTGLYATGSLIGTSSHAVTSSWADKSPATTLETSSTYPVTASWAEKSTATTLDTASTYYVTSSWAEKSPATTLETASTYVITSSWAEKSPATTLATASTYHVTASWADNCPDTTLETASLYLITSSWAESGSTTISSSWANKSPATTLETSSLYLITSSWAEKSPATTLTTASTYDITASWASDAVGYQKSIVTGSSIPITSSWSEDVIASYQKPIVTGSLIPITASLATDVITDYQEPIVTGSLIPITSSWSVDMTSPYQQPIITGSLIPITASVVTSASYAVSSGTSSFLTRNRTYEVTSSYAVTASFAEFAKSAESASWATSSVEAGINLILSSSNYVTSIITATTISSSTGGKFQFVVQPNEAYIIDGYCSVTGQGNAGMKFAISASSVVKRLEIWVEGPTNAITATTRQRLTNVNTLQGTATPNTTLTAPIRIKGTIENGASTNTIGLAVAATTNGQSQTINAGSYFSAMKITKPATSLL